MHQRELVERAGRGDHDAFALIVHGSIVRLEAVARLVLRDPELARDAVQDAYIRAWKGLPGLTGLAYRQLDSVVASGDPASTYSEIVKAGDMTVVLTWSGLGKSFCFAFPPDKSATGKHFMPSLFVPCQEATINVNGKVLPGKPIPREVAGHKMTTAMLAFSETWIRA